MGQILKWNGTEWAATSDDTQDDDADPSNEIQSLSLSGTNVSISEGNTIDLAPLITGSLWNSAGGNVYRASGNVGIGTNNPEGALHIIKTGAPPNTLSPNQNGLLMGVNSSSTYKWIQSYGGALALNPKGNNVGIGIAEPKGALHILKTGAPPASLSASENGLLLGVNSTSTYKWIQSYGGPLAINTQGNNVGIGNIDPAAKLDVSGDIRVRGVGGVAKITNGDNNDYVELNANDESFRVILNDVEKTNGAQ